MDLYITWIYTWLMAIVNQSTSPDYTVNGDLYIPLQYKWNDLDTGYKWDVYKWVFQLQREIVAVSPLLIP